MDLFWVGEDGRIAYDEPQVLTDSNRAISKWQLVFRQAQFLTFVFLAKKTALA